MLAHRARAPRLGYDLSRWPRVFRDFDGTATGIKYMRHLADNLPIGAGIETRRKELLPSRAEPCSGCS